MKFLIVFLLLIFCFGFRWSNFSIKREVQDQIKIQSVWTIDTAKDKKLKQQFVHNSPPLIIKNVVIQGNAINGIKAYKKSKGQQLWSFNIPSGVSSPVIWHKKSIYFGGADGFFYSLQLKTGKLNWKFWTGSENSGAPLIHKERIYWTTSNQKIYALNLKGKLLWIYSGPSLPKGFVVRGSPQPVVHNKWIYTGFYEGSLVALDKKTGRFQWKFPLAPSYSIRDDLKISGHCLFVPVFNFHLFCLNPLNRKVRWKMRGGSSSHLTGAVVYQSYKGKMYAFKRKNGSLVWKKNIKPEAVPLSPAIFKNYLIYGYPSKGRLVFADRKSGKTVMKHKFGRGLAAPVSLDLKNNNAYFFSVDAYLHKISIK